MVDPDTPVLAICDGRILKNATNKIVKNSFLIIEHINCFGYNSLYAYYGHVRSDLMASREVRAGEAIANVREWPGNRKNTHLHLGISTRFFDGVGKNTWGYQQGDIISRGWLDPEQLLHTRPPEKQAKEAIPKSHPANRGLDNKAEATKPKRQEVNPNRRYNIQAGRIHRHHLDLQKLCESEYKEKVYYQGRVVRVQHSYEPRPGHLHGNHYCIVEFVPSNRTTTFMSVMQLIGLQKSRTAHEWIDNLMAQTCYKNFKGSTFVRGEASTPMQGKAWCEVNAPTTKLYY